MKALENIVKIHFVQYCLICGRVDIEEGTVEVIMAPLQRSTGA